jgi:hypothetical protein
MSKYMQVKSTIKNPQSLLKALDDLRLGRTANGDMKVNGVTLRTNWTGFGGKNTPVAVAVQKSELPAGFMDGIGFAWNGDGYDMIIDHYDVNQPVINQIKQRYSINEAKRLAKINGYNVTEQATADGSVRLVCSSYGGF